MSSPDGLQSDFLSRWMNSSTRAGVILSPCPELAASLRHIAPSLRPNDSFTSDFAPLPASVDSSCVGVDGSGRPSGGARPGTDGEIESLEEMATETQHLTLMMKLDQLRKWQQHMQEQLKAHQLEELLCLQEEQQRLLEMINGSQHCTENRTESLEQHGADCGEDTLQAASYHRGSLHSPTINPHGQTQGSTCGLPQEQDVIPTERQQCLSKGHNAEVEDAEEDGLWNSEDDEQDQDVDATVIPHCDVALVEDSDRKEDNTLNDRPIKPGIGVRKQTFEELLEEQLRLEEQRLKSIRQHQSADDHTVQAVPKRAFLKRGEGLSRFTNCTAALPKPNVTKDSKPQLQARRISRSNSEPAAISKGATNGAHRLPVQRKTAILNKENRLRGSSLPTQDIRVESKATWTKVLGSHQRQNTETSEGRQTKLYPTLQPGPGKEQNSRKVGSAVEIVKESGSHNMETNPVSVLEGTRKTEGIPIRKQNSDSGVESPEGEKEEGGGFPQDSFESSFQEKLRRWECDQRLESMELGEFELLEEAAEELSFSSNSSFVMKVLQMDRQLQAAKGLHQRRLSSTPIKSPPGDAPQRRSGGTACNEICSSSEDSDSQIRDGMLKSKVGLEDKNQQDRERKDRHDNTDTSSCGESEFEEQNAAVNPPSFPSALCFPVPSNPPYDKRSYQDDDSCRDSASDVSQGDAAESDGVLSNADDDTLIEDIDGQQGGIVFDDDDTWNDLEEATGAASCAVSEATGSGSSPPERILLRKVAVSKVVVTDTGTVTLTNQEPDPPPSPPTSQLMTKLFPSLKPKVQNAPVTVSSAAGESRKAEEETGQHVQSQQLRLRLAELEIEIERFKKENAALCKLRQENEKHQESLRKERLEFEQMRAEELSKFEEYKKEENRKLQKERKLFEKHVSAARAIPDKKEREEIQTLKQQLSSLQEELKRRESRWASTHSRLRQQIDSLNQDNSSLRDEVCVLEKLRLSAWRKTSMEAEQDKEGKDKMSVTKGVKFASPLASRSGGSSPPQISTAAVPKGSCRENGQGGRGSLCTGMKSSLRKPAGSGSSSSSSSTSSFFSSSSSSAPVKRTEEKSTPSAKTEDNPNPNQDPSLSSSLETDSDSSEVTELESAQEVITHPDGKVEKVLSGGSRLIIFPNGTRKEVSADGLTMKVTFFNGDTKQITTDQRVIYFYSEAQTTHITYPDGVEVLHFPNNQTEKHFPDGRKEITFPDQTVKNLFPNGREESVLTDGTVIQVNPDGSKEIHFNTGQKEIHTPDYKRREYPDGTVKTVYSDGRQETHYPTGRVRVKDKDGNVILDNRA